MHPGDKFWLLLLTLVIGGCIADKAIDVATKNQSNHIRASSIELTGPGGQIVIMVDNDKPVLRVIDAKKVGGVDRSCENLFSEGR